MNLFGLLISLFLFFMAVVIHEYAHGWVAYKFGDPTAKYSGRLTINPLAHIDLYGTIIFPLLMAITTGGRFIFGWAKPVPINFWSLDNPKRDIIWVGLAGPMANFSLATVATVLIKYASLPPFIISLLQMIAVYNLLLGVFNLIPIPPLDGSRVLMGLLPRQLALEYMKLEPFGFIILFIMLFLGLFDNIVWPIVIKLLRLLGISY